MVEQLDPRTKRTKDAILKTFKEMLIEMDLSQITIKELTYRVGINRKTFYHHYEHIEALIQDMEKQLIEASIESFKPSFENKDFHSFLVTNFKFWAIEIDFIYTFFSRRDLEEIYNEFSKTVFELNDYRKFWPDLKHHELIENYAYGATNSLFSYWYTHDKYIPIDEFAEISANLIEKGVNSITACK